MTFATILSIYSYVRKRGKIYVHNLKVSPYMIFNDKGGNSDFTVEKPGRYHFKQVTKVNTTIKWTSKN